MEHDVFVGRATIPSSSHDVEDFDLFHNLLLGSPIDLTQRLLEKKRQSTAAAYLLHHVDPSLLADDQVTLLRFNHAVTSMAEEHMDIHLGGARSRAFYFGLGWVAYSRASLDQALAYNPMADQIRKESIFYREDGIQLRSLGHQALATVEPQGPYKHYAFAAGVAYGLLVPKVPRR
jgi:hypothetical protein